MSQPVSETTVVIRGTPYTLRTDLGDDLMAELASVVNEKMDELDPRGQVPPGKISVLASLSLAGDLRQAQSQASGVDGNVVARLERMNDLLDEALQDE